MRRRSQPSPHHTVLSIEVSGGFLKGVKLEFDHGVGAAAAIRW
jgi:hypothetical protein